MSIVKLVIQTFILIYKVLQRAAFSSVSSYVADWVTNEQIHKTIELTVNEHMTDKYSKTRMYS